MQPVDLTTLRAALAELQAEWIPARCEGITQRDRDTLVLRLRTLAQRGSLTLAWHPQAARLCLGDPPAREAARSLLGERLRQQLPGLALQAIEPLDPWERVVDLRFAYRPADPTLWHLYAEVLGKHSNAILADAEGTIAAVARPIGAQASGYRVLQAGERYEPPPPLLAAAPSLQEPYERWRERVGLVPGSIQRRLLASYRGLSPGLASVMLAVAGVDAQQSSAELSEQAWQRLFQAWGQWLRALEAAQFEPGWTESGYTVLGWAALAPAADVQTLLHQYYTAALARQDCQRLHRQLAQTVERWQRKLRQRIANYSERLQQAQAAETDRQQADLLMAYAHACQPGQKAVALPDFETGDPVTVALDPDKTIVQNAQQLYQRHRKRKRARQAVEPLLAAARQELAYLERVGTTLAQLSCDGPERDLTVLAEIREELHQQRYLRASASRSQPHEASQPDCYRTPSGFEVLVGRNNRQNDRLAFYTASDYDLWFHAQQAPGSHVLLRLPPGAAPDASDLQFSADLAARYSQGEDSDRVPVACTQPQHLNKPKGARPGMVVYTNERALWGNPQQARHYRRAAPE